MVLVVAASSLRLCIVGVRLLERARGCGVVAEVVTMVGMSTDSDWNRVRCERRSLLNSLAWKVPARMGAVKVGQRRRHVVRKETTSRPECRARVSQTAEVKRFQTVALLCSSGALTPDCEEQAEGEIGGGERERILRASDLV